MDRSAGWELAQGNHHEYGWRVSQSSGHYHTKSNHAVLISGAKNPQFSTSWIWQNSRELLVFLVPELWGPVTPLSQLS